jgi:mannose-6-phosphate isomerase-like protein (cupin superfamily)
MAEARPIPHTATPLDLSPAATRILSGARIYIEGGDAEEASARLHFLCAFLCEQGEPSRDALVQVLPGLLRLPNLPGEAPAPTQIWLEWQGEGRCLPEPHFGHETKPWGEVHLVGELAHTGIVRLVVAPGQTLPNHLHLQMAETERVLAAGLWGWCDNAAPTPLPAGQIRRWNLGQTHGYHNPGPHPVGLLCLDSPPFIPEDEREVPPLAPPLPFPSVGP